MKTPYYLHTCCLFILFSQSLLAQENNVLDLPSANHCSLDSPPAQRALFLDHCLRLANTGNADAQYKLGLYYLEGKLIPADYPQALLWFKKASQLAHPDAQLQLGRMYYKGLGTPPDNLQAYIILKIASINGSDQAMDEADIVASRMSNDELSQATAILGKTLQNYMKTIKPTTITQTPNNL